MTAIKQAGLLAWLLLSAAWAQNAPSISFVHRQGPAKRADEVQTFDGHTLTVHGPEERGRGSAAAAPRAAFAAWIAARIELVAGVLSSFVAP